MTVKHSQPEQLQLPAGHAGALDAGMGADGRAQRQCLPITTTVKTPCGVSSVSGAVRGDPAWGGAGRGPTSRPWARLAPRVSQEIAAGAEMCHEPRRESSSADLLPHYQLIPSVRIKLLCLALRSASSANDVLFGRWMTSPFQSTNVDISGEKQKKKTHAYTKARI